MAASDTVPEDEESNRRRLILIVLVLVLAAAGGGLGTFVLDIGDDGGPGPGTPDGSPPATGTPSDAPPSPTDTVTPSPGENVTFEFVDGASLANASGVVPGESGETRRAIRNTGTVAATLAVVNVSVIDRENGITAPESDVDDSPDEGELSEHLLVRLSVESPDGETVRVFGGEEFVPLDDVTAENESVGADLGAGETATLLFEYRIPETVGNEIQSDTVSFDVGFQLRAPDGSN